MGDRPYLTPKHCEKCAGLEKPVAWAIWLIGSGDLINNPRAFSNRKSR
jgi:hypothetical protein